MQLVLERKWKKSNYTIGNLYINGKWIANTLEDVDRNLNSSMSVEQIKAIKKLAAGVGQVTVKNTEVKKNSIDFGALM